jgi:Zn-dependent membrane protease YugP
VFWAIDPLYLGLIVVTLVISAGAQIFISSSYKKWAKVRNSTGVTGTEAGKRIISANHLGVSGGRSISVETHEMKRLEDLRSQGIITESEYRAKLSQLQGGSSGAQYSSIKLERVSGKLTDHYDPRTNTVRLSDKVATQPSVASMAIVAHELGHAQQHENHSILISMRNVLLPALTISPMISYILILIGLIFYIQQLFYLGIVFYGIMVLFAIITVPVELDASRRGLKLLDQAGLVRTDSDKQGSRRVLMAAASTYLAAALTAVLQLLYYISIARRRS